MAKKTKDAPAKKRKTTKVSTRQTDEAPPLGTIAVPVQVECKVQNTSPFDELVIELGCLGLSEEPDKVIARSGYLIDPDRPPTTSEEGVHLYFKPALPGAGTYGFNLFCIYNEAVEARTAAPEDEDTKEAQTA